MMMMESSVKREENVEDYVKKARLNSTLAALLHDPILADVPKNPTLSDVDINRHKRWVTHSATVKLGPHCAM